MEGRIRRENLTSPQRPVNSGGSSAPQSGRYAKGSARSSSRSYSRRRYPAKKELIPEGRDLLIVQLLASGVLLLFVMFVAIIDTEGTLLVRQKLNDAFSKKTTFTELTQNVSEAQEKLTGGAGTVFEIFGGELNDDKDGVDVDIEANDTDKTQQRELNTESDAAIDAETLKQLSEYAEDYSKN